MYLRWAVNNSQILVMIPLSAVFEVKTTSWQMLTRFVSNPAFSLVVLAVNDSSDALQAPISQPAPRHPLETAPTLTLAPNPTACGVLLQMTRERQNHHSNGWFQW
jgi:hypothetical protein